MFFLIFSPVLLYKYNKNNYLFFFNFFIFFVILYSVFYVWMLVSSFSDFICNQFLFKGFNSLVFVNTLTVCFFNNHTDIFHFVKQEVLIAHLLFFYCDLVVAFSLHLYNVFFIDRSKYKKNNCLSYNIYTLFSPFFYSNRFLIKLIYILP